MKETVSVPRRKVWLVAARPWALPASTMPVFFGTALAVTFGGAPFQPIRFLLALLAMVLLHTAANMRSDVADFRRGLDTEVTPVSGALVRGWLSPETLARVSTVLFAAGGLLGAALAWITGGPALWWIGGAGVAIGAAYSSLKYRALGDLAVFLNFGLLGSAGAWVVQAGTFSVYPVLAAVPMSFLVVAILHANNWRDADGDAGLQVRTVAGLLGDRGSERYYGALLALPFLWTVAMIAAPQGFRSGVLSLPPSFVLVLLAVPLARKLWRRAKRRNRPVSPLDFVALDGATARLNLLFGILCLVALLIHAGWRTGWGAAS